MVHLPTEILQPILQGLKDEHILLAPLSTVNRHWQAISERIMWRHLTIHVRDLKQLNRVFHANPDRRKALRELLIIYENYFIDSRDENGETHDEEIDDEACQTEAEHDFDSEPVANEQQDGTTANDGGEKSFEDDEGNEGESEYEIQQRFSTYQKEQLRIFQETKSIWDELASWEDNLEVTEITLYIKGRSIYELLGPSFTDFDTVQKYFENKSLYLSDTPQLPLLPSVKTLLVLEPTNQEIDLWPAVVACNIASALPKLERLELSGTDMHRRWKHVRKQFREGK